VIKDVKELKDLILFAKQHKVLSVKVGEVTFVMSNAALYYDSDGLPIEPDSSGNTEGKVEPENPEGNPASAESWLDDEDTLLHSAE
jgi:hypothetical protein